MHEINLTYKATDWAKNPWTVDTTDMCKAVQLAIASLEVVLDSKPYQLLPVGLGEFIIWSQGGCIGFLGIKEVGQQTSAPDLEGGR